MAISKAMNSTKDWLTSLKTRHAIKTGLAAVLSIIIYQYFHLNHGYWAVITAVVIMQSNMETGSLETTMKLSLQRFVGTLSGAIVGFFIVLIMPPNYWELLTIIFFLILIGSYLTTIYQGFALAGPTATILVLLTQHEAMSNSLAFDRIIEIFIGLVVAIAVTILIWPQRMKDHLKQNQQKRFKQLKHQLSQLIQPCNGEKLDRQWFVAQSDLLIQIKGERTNSKFCNDEEFYCKELGMEFDLAKYINRLGESLTRVPNMYWDSIALQNSTVAIINLLTQLVDRISNNKDTADLIASIDKATEAYEEAFAAFRENYRNSDKTQLDIEDIHQIFTAYHSLHKSTEIMKQYQSATLA